MRRVRRRVIGLILVIIVCWVDYQYFTEGFSAMTMNSVFRRAGHLFFLGVLIPVGWWGLAKEPPWQRKLWVVLYSVTFLLLLIVGIFQWKWGVFPTSFLDQMSGLRLLFTSPVVFMVLMLIRK